MWANTPPLRAFIVPLDRGPFSTGISTALQEILLGVSASPSPKPASRVGTPDCSPVGRWDRALRGCPSKGPRL
jgi:hypothetical protein